VEKWCAKRGAKPEQPSICKTWRNLLTQRPYQRRTFEHKSKI
jgi:hypothetical protein